MPVISRIWARSALISAGLQPQQEKLEPGRLVSAIGLLIPQCRPGRTTKTPRLQGNLSRRSRSYGHSMGVNTPARKSALRALERHTDQKWVLLYVARWLKAPMLMPDGTMVARVKGTPQGGPISPLIANIFLHHGFDAWMTREYPGVQFERFADDVVVHCVTERQARQVREAIGRRLVDIGLQLHPYKTKIVYCKDSRRRQEYEQVTFTFCGYAFRPRQAFDRKRKEVY